MLLISLSCVNFPARTSRARLNRCGESEHLCLVPGLRGKALIFSPLSLISPVGCHMQPSSSWETLFCWECLSWKDVEFRHSFSESIDVIGWFCLSFCQRGMSHLLIWVCWIIILGQIPLDHQECSFSGSATFVLLVFCWGFLHLFHQRYWLVILFPYSTIAWLWYRGNASLMQWAVFGRVWGLVLVLY
jgi:hypothetical protein